MTAAPRAPLAALPAGFREKFTFVATERGNYLLLNLLAAPLLVAALVLMAFWMAFARAVRGATAMTDLNELLMGVLVILIVLPAHELVHGLAIQYTGHAARYGWKTLLGVPLVLYATPVNPEAVFRRGEYLLAALAPLVALTLVGMALVWVVPDGLGYYVGLGVALNAAGAAGDVWMSVLALRQPPGALFRDEGDTLRVFVPDGSRAL